MGVSAVNFVIMVFQLLFLLKGHKTLIYALFLSARIVGGIKVDLQVSVGIVEHILVHRVAKIAVVVFRTQVLCETIIVERMLFAEL